VDLRFALPGSPADKGGSPEGAGQVAISTATGFHPRAGRNLLGKVALKDGGGDVAKRGSHLPFKGESGSLHSILKGNPFIWPFVGLPSKENGLDIAGCTTPDGKSLFFGLRGPRVDRYAVVLELETNGGLNSIKQKIVTHFLDLDGGAVRDLAQLSDKETLVLAGPVGEVPGPFGLYLWRPRQSRCAQPTTNLHWPTDPILEKPEGIARLERNGMNGIIVLYDSLDPCKRISGSRYIADWFPFP